MISPHSSPALRGTSSALSVRRIARGNRTRPLRCCGPACATKTSNRVHTRIFCIEAKFRGKRLTLKNLTPICCHLSSVYPTNHFLPSGRESLRRRSGSSEGICMVKQIYRNERCRYLDHDFLGEVLSFLYVDPVAVDETTAGNESLTNTFFIDSIVRSTCDVYVENSHCHHQCLSHIRAESLLGSKSRPEIAKGSTALIICT